MKFVIVAAALLALAVAAPLDSDKTAQILRLENDNIGTDGFQYSYETSNGIAGQEQGQLKVFNPEQAAVVVRGSYSFVGDDGQTYTVNYVADENGFQPEGAHLPKAA